MGSLSRSEGSMVIELSDDLLSAISGEDVATIENDPPLAAARVSLDLGK